MGKTSHYHVFETAGGYCGIAWNETGITRFQLPTSTRDGTRRLLLRRIAGTEMSEPPRHVAGTIDLVRRYFAGETVDFSSVAVDLDDQEDFFRRIYAATRRLGWGQTTTYGALAKQLGAGPEVARDVGQAMARNPVALIIPCHRVLAAGNKIGGFSAPGGSTAKQRMLELEGIKVAPPKPVQQSLAL